MMQQIKVVCLVVLGLLLVLDYLRWRRRNEWRV